MQVVARLGLTGGIGSGKTTVAQLFGRYGAAVIDADAIARSVTAPGGLAIQPIIAGFGNDFITADGALDREKMRELAYSDAGERKRLESIIHPLVGQETERQAKAAIQAGHRCIVFDVPLLVESPHWRQKVDQVLVVDCTPEIQIDRAMARSGLSQTAVENVISSQARRERRLRAADIVIFNVGLSLDELALEIRQISHRFGL